MPASAGEDKYNKASRLCLGGQETEEHVGDALPLCNATTQSGGIQADRPPCGIFWLGREGRDATKPESAVYCITTLRELSRAMEYNNTTRGRAGALASATILSDRLLCQIQELWAYTNILSILSLYIAYIVVVGF
jgi:hypothetical protein